MFMRRRINRNKQDFELKLEQEFPFMKQKEVTDEQWEKGGYSSYDAYGCCVGEGWYDILRGLCLDITKAYEAANLPVDIVVVQVKEKFGTLRFYSYPAGHNPGVFAFDFIGSGSLRMSPGETVLHKEISNIKRKWEEASGNVCERCGAEAELRTDLGWIKTYCDSCYADVKAHREAAEKRRKEREENPQLIEAERKAEEEEKRRCTLTVEDVAGIIEKETLSIPERVKYIDEKVFDAFTRIKCFSVDKNNKTLSATDGVLLEETRYDDELRLRLVRYPANKKSVSYTVLEGVTWIGGDSFKGCTMLESIIIPGTVSSIAWGAFSESGIKNISVDSENRDFSDVDGVLFSKYKTELHAYPPGKKLDFYEVTEEVVKIWHDAFKNAQNLIRISIPNSVGFIGNNAFEGCTNLKEVTMHKAILNDDCRVFYNCPSLEQIIVMEDKEEFSAGRHLNSIDNVLFKGPITYSRLPKDGEKNEWVEHTLMRYPPAKKQICYVIPEGITNILEYAFSGQNFLQSIIIDASVTKIGEGAFEGCSEDFTFICQYGSYAHDYAKDNNMKYVFFEVDY